jgi:hypothetical protein
MSSDHLRRFFSNVSITADSAARSCGRVGNGANENAESRRRTPLLTNSKKGAYYARAWNREKDSTFGHSRRERRVVCPLTERVAINLNRRVANTEPLGEHRSSRVQQRVVIVLTRAGDVGGQCDEPARDRPNMEVVDVRHVW